MLKRSLKNKRELQQGDRLKGDFYGERTEKRTGIRDGVSEK
jgi:hypothetical protein